jgi:hypothetical protein
LKITDQVELKIREWFAEITIDVPRKFPIPIFCPNFNYIRERIEAIRSQTAEAIIIVPEWEGRSWMNDIKENAVASLILGEMSSVLLDKFTSYKWTMIAFVVDGRRKKIYLN